LPYKDPTLCRCRIDSHGGCISALNFTLANLTTHGPELELPDVESAKLAHGSIEGHETVSNEALPSARRGSPKQINQEP
jgi:hypothetical protein